MATHVKALIVAAIVVSVSAGMAHATTITVANFSFEDPVVGAATNYTAPGWSNGGSGNQGMFNLGVIVPTYMVPNQTDGSQVAYINPGGALYQTIALSTYTISAGDVIKLQVDVAWSPSEARPPARPVSWRYTKIRRLFRTH